MATLYRCDRCRHEQAFQIDGVRQNNSGGGVYAELCKACLEDFMKWVKKGKT